MDCPICFNHSISIFKNTCGHDWCKKCHKKLIFHNHTSCPLCRENIVLEKPIERSKYLDWLVNGGAPYIWRTKRNRKYLKYLRYRL